MATIHGRTSPITADMLPAVEVYITRADHVSVTYGGLRVTASQISHDRSSVCVRDDQYQMLGEVYMIGDGMGDARRATVEALRQQKCGLRQATDYGMIGAMCDDLKNKLA